MSAERKGAGRALATVIVGLVVLASLLALRPDRWLAPPAASPTSAAGELPSGTPALGPDTVWRTLTVEPLDSGPGGAMSVVGWPGGYLALGHDENAHLLAWISADGRSWTPLPDGTFGVGASNAEATAAFGGLFVGVQGPDPGATVETFQSLDGRTWTRRGAPRLDLCGLATNRRCLATSNGGVLALVRGDPNRLAFSADGTAWQFASPPSLNRTHLQVVAAFRGGFAAMGSQLLPVVDDSGTSTGSSVETAAAWWSTDGLRWQSAAVSDALLGSFVRVYPASQGLAAVSESGDAADAKTYWQSFDGLSWTVSDAAPIDPDRGSYEADGNHLLAHTNDTEPREFWTSLDGQTWTRLELAGAEAHDAASGTAALLLPDGVLFPSAEGGWLGTASPRAEQG